MQCTCAIFHLWPLRLYDLFPHYFINCTIFGGGGNLLNIKFVVIFSKTLSETFCILRRADRDIIKNFYWLSCKVPAILSACDET